MSKKGLFISLFLLLGLISQNGYAVVDFGHSGNTGSSKKSIETEGYYLKFAQKELEGAAIICDCKCSDKCICPPGPCDCPVPEWMKGALELFGRMGFLKSELPKIKNVISKEDYAPYLLSRLSLQRSQEKKDNSDTKVDVDALEIIVMSPVLVKLVQSRDDKGNMQNGNLIEARKELQKWVLKQIKIPRSQEDALKKFENEWGWQKDQLAMTGRKCKDEICEKYENITCPYKGDGKIQDKCDGCCEYLKVTCPDPSWSIADCRRPTDVAFELIGTEMNTLKHTGMINNYALSKAYILTLNNANDEVKKSFEKVVGSSGNTFQARYQNLGELELHAMSRLNELGKLSAKYAETAAVKTFSNLLDILREEETEEETE